MHSPVLLAGKRAGQGQLNLVVPGKLLCVVDSLSGQQFLADTGAAYSCLPCSQQAAAQDVPRLKGPAAMG
jgi:hypothetical protein